MSDRDGARLERPGALEHDPRTVAEAVVELARDRVVEAVEYQRSWAALRRAGVSPSDTRAVLDDEVLDTVAIGAVQRWSRERAGGVLVIHGPPGVGKSFAAARWALERHRDGFSTVWLAAVDYPRDRPRDSATRSDGWTDRGEWLDRGARATALVVDDVGAGQATGSAFAERVRAVLIQRHGERRPTLVLCNTHGLRAERRDQVRAWLGERLWDRLAQAGGVVSIDEGKSLRRDERGLDIDEHGHSKRWRETRALVDLVGCERIIDLDTDTPTYRVGDRLDSAARREGMAACDNAIAQLGLDPLEVKAAADAVASRRSDHEQSAALVKAAISKALQADNARRARVCYDAVADKPSRRGTQCGSLDDVKPPEWTLGPDGVRRLKRLGFRVRSGYDGFELVRVRPRDRTTREPARGGAAAYDVVTKGADTVEDAWESARRLCVGF